MIEINRWLPGTTPTPNPLFLDIFENGKGTWHSPLLCCSGKYEGCIEHNGKVYENWVNWGMDCLYELQSPDLENEHQDPEGRVGETYKVDQCRTDYSMIKDNERRSNIMTTNTPASKALYFSRRQRETNGTDGLINDGLDRNLSVLNSELSDTIVTVLEGDYHD